MSEIWMDVDTALSEVPVNKVALIDDTDFKTREESVVYNQAGLDLVWNFVTTTGAYTQTAVTPTTAGVYDWTNQGNGMYSIEIPASGGASINNDTEGFGWFTGFATGILPWTGPIIGFRAAALNNALIDGGDVLDVNVTEWLGTAAATPTTAGVPEVDVTYVSGVLEDIATETKQDTAQTDLDDIQTRLPAALVGGRMDSNVGAISGDTTAADNLESQYDTTGLTGDTFPATQSQLGGLANVGSATNRPAVSYTLTTGTQSANTYIATEALDGTRHEHTDAAGAMELYYEFNVGSGIPSSVQVTGYVNGGNDDLDVYGYDWVAADWVQIGNMQGTGSTVNLVRSYDMFVNMVGTGANIGVARIRFYKASGLTTATLAIDQIFIAFSQSASGYENGRIWINTALSNTNTVVGVDGIATNPVSTIGAAKTLSAASNLTDFHIINGSSITLAANSDDESYFGDNWALALGGQSCDNIQVVGATVSGIGTSAVGEMHFEGCDMNTMSGQLLHFDFCGVFGTVTQTLAGDYNYHNCYSKVAGAGSPTFAKTAGQAITAQWRNWAGSITFSGLEATDTLTVGGTLGTVDLGSPAGAVNVEIRGTYKEITNIGSAVVNLDGAILAGDVADILVDTGTTIPGLLDGITNTGSAVNVVAESYTLTTGTQSANTYTATAPLDQVRHEHTDAAGAMELYYQFDVGSEGVPSSVTTTGYLTGGNDTLDVFAYNWGATSWDQIGNLVGAGGTDQVNTYALYTTHVGTGANLGKVRIRYYAASGLTTATLAIDQIFVSHAVIPVSRQTKGTVVDVSPAASGFDTDLTEPDAHWDDALLIFTSGTLADQARPISTFLNTNGAMTFASPDSFTTAPSNGDAFIVYHTHIHPISQVQSGLATEAKQDIIDTGVDNLLLGIIYGSAVTGTLSTTQATSDLTGYADDQLIGRVIIWTSGACEGEGTDITDYASASGLLTFTALTTAPGNGDTFKIV